MTTLRLGIIGFGTIATDIWIELSKLSDIQIEWAALLRPGSDKPLPESFKRFDGLQALLDWKPDLVIEAASQKAVQLHAADIACQGIDVVITSVGALADSSIHDHLFAQARKSGAQVIVPSGAVASLDYLGALNGMLEAQITYESRKPPAAWKAELEELGYQPDRLESEVLLFSGNAQEAALRFPKNLNVAATLALAGIGMERTKVRVVVDPSARGNQHKIIVDSPLGTLETTLCNNPSPDNPKTSWVVARSVAYVVRKRFATLVVGG